MATLTMTADNEHMGTVRSQYQQQLRAAGR
jgi:hypothetical protein